MNSAVLNSQKLITSVSSSHERIAAQCFRRLSSRAKAQAEYNQNLHDRNTRLGMYAGSVVIGAIGATYASVPLYKLFCQTTGFGGTTQRVDLEDSEPVPSPFIFEDDPGDKSLSAIIRRRMLCQLDAVYLSIQSFTRKTISGNRVANTHGNTWTDEDAASKLSSLKPVKGGRLLRIYLDANTSDVLPWSFKPTQSSVRVVPGETALCFFTCTNHSDKPITGVATYNVHPPKAGLYFNKVQCFCFEEQRLLPGETVDMPVFFYIDPEWCEDPYMDRVGSITLSYTFFKTDIEYGDDDEEDDEDEAA